MKGELDFMTQMQYRVVRSNQEKLSFSVTGDLNVVIMAPLDAENRVIDEYVKQNASLIYERYRVIKQRQELRKSFKKEIGDTLLLMGEEYPIEESLDGEIGFDGERFYMPREADFAEVKKTIIRVYQILAEQLIHMKVTYYQSQLGVFPRKIKIRGDLRRWSVCLGKGDLAFSWMLMMAGKDEVDYVVVHTLCHLKEKRHTAAFWEMISSVLPNYRESQIRLQALAERISNENWNERERG